jgi:hypothetical protein
MRRNYILAIVLASFATLSAQESIGSPRVGTIEFYGLRTVSPQLARQALGLSEGSMLPASKAEAEDRLTDISQVTAARVEAVCCEKGAITLYIGIDERGQPRYDVRPAPGGAEELPPEIRSAYQDLQNAIHAAELRGPLTEDLTTGQPSSTNPDVRAQQQKFPPLVDANIAILRQVVRESGDEYQRATAAYLLPYATSKFQIVDDLREALSDNDPVVRSHAIHGLTALALLERADAGSRVRVSPTWFIEMLQSITWTDRTQAAWALETLTEDRDIFTLSRLRGTVIDALREMAVWKSKTHARAPFFLLGRVAGLEEAVIQSAWARDDRQVVLAAPRQ